MHATPTSRLVPVGLAARVPVRLIDRPLPKGSHVAVLGNFFSAHQVVRELHRCCEFRSKRSHQLTTGEMSLRNDTTHQRHEVLAPEDLMPRALELAGRLAALPDLTRRYARLVLTQRLKRLLDEGIGYGLALEGLGALELTQGLPG